MPPQLQKPKGADMSLLIALRDSITSLDTDQGVPEDNYNAIYSFAKGLLGEAAASELSKHVDATEGAFYIATSDEFSIDDLWGKLLGLALKEDEEDALCSLARTVGWSEEQDNDGQIVFYTDVYENEQED